MIDYFIQELSTYLQSSSLLAFVAVYLGGVLVSFTPCVYPVAPITIAFIGAHGSGSKRKGFVLSIIYVLGMSITYTALGAIAALSGKLFGQLQTNPWTYMIMANICILMGLAMLDVYVLPWRTPQFIARMQPREKTKGIISSFLIGMASGLVMGPCTTPVLAVLLGYVATQQNLFFAATLLFVFAFGLGTFLIILGTFAGLLANLPRSGPWMVRITHLFGWILIGTGEYFLIQSGVLWG
ncbi:MAG: sulfite exporter TauE/SafE family protein [Deltaproteobacteria bacterium]|nr:sulfite exporter TauE/SafE family protein [Deltaproteobacteria bacterium]